MLVYVNPDNLHDYWDLVKTGLTRILDRTKDRWKPEDVYHMLKSNAVGLYVQDSLRGFAILQPLRGWDGNELIIFCGYSMDGHDVVMQDIEQIKEIGRGMNAKRIKFQTNRQGFDKRVKEMGFTLDLKQWECEI